MFALLDFCTCTLTSSHHVFLGSFRGFLRVCALEVIVIIIIMIIIVSSPIPVQLDGVRIIGLMCCAVTVSFFTNIQAYFMLSIMGVSWISGAIYDWQTNVLSGENIHRYLLLHLLLITCQETSRRRRAEGGGGRTTKREKQGGTLTQSEGRERELENFILQGL